MQPTNFPVARFIDSFNIKYNILKDITDKKFSNPLYANNSEVINLYIDLNSMLKPIYHTCKGQNIEDYSGITASLINVCSHYRRFYLTRYGVYTRIFIINSKNNHYLNRQLVYDYNKSLQDAINANDIAKDLIEHNMKLLNILVPYLPNIFLIDTTFETGVMIYDIMSRNDVMNEKTHIILTKDTYNYQLCSMKPNTYILRKRNSDIAEYISSDTLMNVYLKEKGTKVRTDIISSELYTVLLAMSSVHQRNIKSAINISKSIKALERAIKDHRLINKYNSDISYLWKSILLYGNIKADAGTLTSRFKAIDIMFQHNIFMQSSEHDYSDRLINLNDPNGVREINNKYFAKNPLDLNNL